MVCGVCVECVWCVECVRCGVWSVCVVECVCVWSVCVVECVSPHACITCRNEMIGCMTFKVAEILGPDKVINKICNNSQPNNVIHYYRV